MSETVVVVSGAVTVDTDSLRQAARQVQSSHTSLTLAATRLRQVASQLQALPTPARLSAAAQLSDFAGTIETGAVAEAQRLEELLGLTADLYDWTEARLNWGSLLQHDRIPMGIATTFALDNFAYQLTAWSFSDALMAGLPSIPVRLLGRTLGSGPFASEANGGLWWLGVGAGLPSRREPSDSSNSPVVQVARGLHALVVGADGLVADHSELRLVASRKHPISMPSPQQLRVGRYLGGDAVVGIFDRAAIRAGFAPSEARSAVLPRRALANLMAALPLSPVGRGAILFSTRRVVAREYSMGLGGSASRGRSLLTAAAPAAAGSLAQPLPAVPTPRTTAQLLQEVRDLRDRPTHWAAQSLGSADLEGQGGSRVPDYGEFEILRHETPGNERPSWTVVVKGTQEWGIGKPNPKNLEANLAGVARVQMDEEAAIIAGLEEVGARSGDAVELVGHSQGGIVAAALATNPHITGTYEVASVVTAGSPISRIPVPAQIPLLAFDNVEDPVPALDGALNRASSEHLTVYTCSGQGLEAHDLGRYVEAAKSLDKREHGDVVAWMRQRETRLGISDGTVSTPYRFAFTRQPRAGGG